MNEDALAWQSKSGKQEAVLAKDIRSANWVPIGRAFQLKLGLRGGATIKFDGFRQQVRVCVCVRSRTCSRVCRAVNAMHTSTYVACDAMSRDTSAAHTFCFLLAPLKILRANFFLCSCVVDAARLHAGL